MASLTSLLAEVHRCTLCTEHLPLGPRPVFQIRASARLLIAAQAPGRKVHASGIPFSDVSGNRLREWLGFTPETFYDPERVAILPMGFCYPGTGQTGDLPPRPECAPAWRQKILSSLPHLKLTLAIGRYAHAYHLPHAGSTVTAVVQSWQQYWPHLVPLPHPSPRNRHWLRRNPWFERDLLPVLRIRIAEILNLPDSSKPTAPVSQ